MAYKNCQKRSKRVRYIQKNTKDGHKGHRKKEDYRQVRKRKEKKFK